MESRERACFDGSNIDSKARVVVGEGRDEVMLIGRCWEKNDAMPTSVRPVSLPILFLKT